MTYGLAVGPDVHVRDLADWFVLGARLQRTLSMPFRVSVYDDVDELHRAYRSGTVDLVLANAADTAVLVREQGFRPLLRPRGVADEACIVAAAASLFARVEDLARPLAVAATGAPDVDRICRILLEPADLSADDLRTVACRNYTLVAKAVLTGQVHVGFFLKAAFDDLTPAVRAGLRELISSQIHVVSHCLLAGPALAPFGDALAGLIEGLADEEAAQRLLVGLGAPLGWERVSAEDVEFMIDLMDALAG